MRVRARDHLAPYLEKPAAEIEDDDLQVSVVLEISRTASAKRQADALELIEQHLAQMAEASNVNGEWSIPAALNRIAQNMRGK